MGAGKPAVEIPGDNRHEARYRARAECHSLCFNNGVLAARMTADAMRRFASFAG